jgi:pimeloyl-ACP methyl ester carboxylesterase
MWYDERGQGDPCVLLHPGGAGVDSRALAPNLDALARSFHVYAPEQRAHGRTPDADGPVTFELMAGDTITLIESVIGRPVHLLGVSDGAIVALTVARNRPDLVRRLVFVAGVFHRDGWEEGVLDGEPPEFLRQSYGEISPDGVGHYDVVVAKLAAMHATEPALSTADLREIAVRTLIMIGDDDQVRLEHAIAMYRSLPDAEFAVVPGTSHGLLVEKPGLCNLIITDFLANDPVQTFAPIRRPAHPSRVSVTRHGVRRGVLRHAGPFLPQGVPPSRGQLTGFDGRR